MDWLAVFFVELLRAAVVLPSAVPDAAANRMGIDGHRRAAVAERRDGQPAVGQSAPCKTNQLSPI